MPNDRPAKIGDNSRSTNTQSIMPANCTIWQPANALAFDIPEAELSSELEAYEESGQRQKPLARLLPNGTFEVITNAHILRVVEAYNKKHPDTPREVIVEVVEFDDRLAFQRLALDVERPAASALGRGQFFAAAIETFGGVSEAAKACKVSKSTVSKNLAVAEGAILLTQKVVDPRTISQRNATWLLQQVRSNDADVATRARDAIDQVSIGTAASVFRALRRALVGATQAPKNRRPLVAADQQIGEVRVVNGRIVAISFADAGDMTPNQIARAVQRAFEQARNQAS